MRKRFLLVLSISLFVAVGLGANPASATTSLPIDQHYASDPEFVTLLGSPLPEPDQSVAGGLKRKYERGAIYWHPSTGAAAVHGPIYSFYVAKGGAAKLGFPTEDLRPLYFPHPGNEPVPVGFVLPLKNGHAIYLSAATGARPHWLRSPIVQEYLDQGGLAFGPGFAIKDEESAANGRGKKVSFERGAIYWSSATGAHWVTGEIAKAYRTQGNSSGPLGLPVTGVEYSPDGSKESQTFENGEITIRNGVPQITNN